MVEMAVPTAPTTAFSRRTLLAASAAGVAVLVAGCTSSGNSAQEVTTEQADSLAEQVAVQERLVAAFTAAAAASPQLKAATAELAAQAREQLDRLKAAAPGSTSASSSAPASGTATAVGPDPKTWLREQVAGAARSHAAACVVQTGARAALLGSISAGLHGQETRLA
jgi:hypothetical protein